MKAKRAAKDDGEAGRGDRQEGDGSDAGSLYGVQTRTPKMWKDQW